MVGGPIATITPCRSLREYVVELLGRLDDNDPDLVGRIHALVGERRARIVLDDEAIEAWFVEGSLTVVDAIPPSGLADGTGRTDRATTLDLLDGYEEVFEAVLAGRLDAVATIDDVGRMFGAIEIVLDGSIRLPTLQRLAAQYRTDPCRAPRPPHDPSAAPERRPGGMYPMDVDDGELALLERLDLVPATKPATATNPRLLLDSAPSQ